MSNSTILLSKKPYWVQYIGDINVVSSLLPNWDDKLIKFIEDNHIQVGEEIKLRILLSEKANSTITKCSLEYWYYSIKRSIDFWYGRQYSPSNKVKLTVFDETENEAKDRLTIYKDLLFELDKQYSNRKTL